MPLDEKQLLIYHWDAVYMSRLKTLGSGFSRSPLSRANCRISRNCSMYESSVAASQGTTRHTQCTSSSTLGCLLNPAVFIEILSSSLQPLGKFPSKMKPSSPFLYSFEPRPMLSHSCQCTGFLVSGSVNLYLRSLHVREPVPWPCGALLEMRP